MAESSLDVSNKRRAEWRYLENGKYDKRPIDPNYFKNYMALKVECPNCSKMILRGDLSKHKKRPICINNKKLPKIIVKIIIYIILIIIIYGRCRR